MPQFHGPTDATWRGVLPSASTIDLAVDFVRQLADPSFDVGSSTFHRDAVELRRKVFESLFDGPGVSIVRGFPVGSWDEVRAQQIFGALGEVFGTLREQSVEGNVLHLVTDRTVLGVSAVEAGGSNSRKRITLHTENARPPHPPHVLSLLSLRAADHGGESLLLDGAHVHRALARRDHELLGRAYRPFQFGRHEADRSSDRLVDHSPIFWDEGGRTMFRYSRHWLDVAVKTTMSALLPEDKSLFDTIDDILEDPSAVIRLRLEPGESVFINNRLVMHGRESFEDSAEAQRRRCLVRMWIDVE